jgi:ABC-type glycerol-3-phosphate transport system substrate-binding protein
MEQSPPRTPACYNPDRMKHFKRFVAATCLFALLGQGCTKGPTQEARKLSEKQELVIWSVVDDEDVYKDILTSFRKAYPYATVTFRRYRLEEYEDQLVNAMAEGRGPDVFMVHNTWIGKYIPKIAPQPPVVKVAEQVMTGTVKKEVVLQVKERKTISPTEVRKQFVDAVAPDAIRSVDVSEPGAYKADMQERVVGLPMSVDTLALYYNKDLLNAAGIAVPPDSWDAFQHDVEVLVRTDNIGEITRQGAGFGTGLNVERAPDIVSLLMMQNRTVMANDGGYPVFNKIPADLSKQVDEAPAAAALRFYTDFANPAKSVYTWNADQPNSLDAFIRGTSAFFVGYNYHLPAIRANAPKVNLGITEIPQISADNKVNFANFWLWTVSKSATSPDLAWYLVNDMTGAERAPLYLEAAKRPAARRALLEDQYDDPDIGVFASQALTAKSWYRGVDPGAMEDAMISMIDSVVSGIEIKDALKLAVEKIEQTIVFPKRR